MAAVHSDYAALAARQPVRQEPAAVVQPGKRVIMLEAACGPGRNFDPAAADAELASVPLVPLWNLPELHPRKVAAECLSTMQQARQSTRPNTAGRVKLTDAIALFGQFIEQMKRSERLGTVPPAQHVNVDVMQLSTLLGNARSYLTQGLNSQCMNLLGDALALIDSGKAMQS